MPREEKFIRRPLSDFGILHSKNGEDAGEEDLPTFPLGMEFLTPENQSLKKRKKENKPGPCHRVSKTIKFSDAIFAFSKGKHTFWKR